MIDVVVIGGGPVGLATAIAARGHGLSVRVIDRQRPPIDKACGEGLMPAGVRALARMREPSTRSYSPQAIIAAIAGTRAGVY